MNTIRGFTADDATVIFGSVIDHDMGDNLRVTIVATGLGGVVSRHHSKPFAVIKNGTDNSAMEVDYGALAAPAVMRRRRDNTVEALKQSGVELLDIPAFLRKQAD
jgi:cell division protein FtsZ